MEFIYNIAEYIANYLDAAFAILFISYTLGRNTRISNKKIYTIITILTVALLGYLQDSTTNSAVQDSIIFTICFVFALLFLNKSIGWKIVVTIIFLLLLTFSNMLVTYGMTSLADISVEQLCSPGTLRLFLLLFHKIVFILMLFISSLLLRKQGMAYRQCLIAIFLFAGILLSCSILINITKTGNLTISQESQLLIVTIGICAISTAVGICVYQMNRQYQRELENTRLLSRLQEEETMLNKMNELYENNRILQHDLTRHFTILQGLLEQDDIHEAECYIREVTQKHLSHASYVYTSSNILNSVLNDKAEQCDKAAITYQVTISGTIEEAIQMNLGIILSNLLDNAIEAECLQQKEDRKIIVQMFHEKGMYHLLVKNYICQSVLDTNPFLLTNKKNKQQHGFGIKSIRKVVHSLDGIYQQYEQESYFITSIILPDSTKCA